MQFVAGWAFGQSAWLCQRCCHPCLVAHGRKERATCCNQPSDRPIKQPVTPSSSLLATHHRQQPMLSQTLVAMNIHAYMHTCNTWQSILVQFVIEGVILGPLGHVLVRMASEFRPRSSPHRSAAAPPYAAAAEAPSATSQLFRRHSEWSCSLGWKGDPSRSICLPGFGMVVLARKAARTFYPILKVGRRSAYDHLSFYE